MQVKLENGGGKVLTFSMASDLEACDRSSDSVLRVSQLGNISFSGSCGDLDTAPAVSAVVVHRLVSFLVCLFVCRYHMAGQVRFSCFAGSLYDGQHLLSLPSLCVSVPKS